MPHVHDYTNNTNMADGHTHSMSGVTSHEHRVGNSHIHYMQGTTGIADHHNHRYRRNATGTAILLPNGSHTHGYGGNTEITQSHLHGYQGQTGQAKPGY